LIFLSCVDPRFLELSTPASQAWAALAARSLYRRFYRRLATKPGFAEGEAMLGFDEAFVSCVYRPRIESLANGLSDERRRGHFDGVFSLGYVNYPGFERQV
jgi:hypothetical protein